jgi:predicted porin
MNIRFAVVAATSVLAALPSYGQGIQVTGATNITISGLLSVGVKNSEFSQGNAATARTAPSETHVDDNTSRLIIASTSKITEGWNVIFRLESRFTPNVRPGDALIPSLGGAPASYAVNDATGFADGDTWGGISSPYGIITVGKSTLYYTDTIAAGYLAPSLEAPGESYRIWDANGLASFNMLSTYLTGSATAAGVLTPTTRNILGNTRSRNVVRYDTNVLKLDAESLFQVSLAWSKNAAGAQNVWVSNANGSTYEGGQTIYGKAVFNGHGFSASASYLDQKFQGVLASAPLTELKAYRLGVSYKWQGLKVGVVYDNSDMVNGISTGTPAVLSDAKRSVFEVPISYSFGDHAVYATYSKAGSTTSLTDTGAKQMNFVYDYALTKRAFLGVYYTNLKNDAHAYYQPFLTGYSPFGGSAIATGESWRQVGIILNYWF